MPPTQKDEGELGSHRTAFAEISFFVNSACRKRCVLDSCEERASDQR